MSQVTVDKQKSAAEGKEEGGRYAKGNIIRLQYTNGDTYEGNINFAKQRDGYGVYICADQQATSLNVAQIIHANEITSPTQPATLTSVENTNQHSRWRQ